MISSKNGQPREPVEVSKGLQAVPVTEGLQATVRRDVAQLQIPRTSSAGVQPQAPTDQQTRSNAGKVES